MAEKRVLVRLAAVGGRQVRAELEGVGEAGKRGFGRLSREMEAANTQLAAFSRRARIALGAAAAGVTTALAAMTRTTIAVANQTQQFAQVANTAPEAFQRWAGASRTVGIEQEKLADILKDVNDRVGDFLSTGGGPMADFFERVAPRVGVTADQFARLSGPEALQLYVDTLQRAGLSQQEMTFYLEAMASDATRLLPLLRNGGAEMARLGAQADNLGAVLDASAIQALQRTQIALVGVGQVFEGIRNRIGVALAPSVEWLANAFVSLASEGGALGRALDALIGNIGRLTTYASTFAAVMAGRWVAGLAAAALSVRGLATALVLLRGALIRTGIGALIVGAGELVFQFGKLVAGAGSLSAAMTLMGDVARAVWDGMTTTMGSFLDDFRALGADIEGVWVRLMAFLSGKWADFLGQIAPGFNAVAAQIGSDTRLDAVGARAYASMLENAAGNRDSMADRFRDRAAGTRGSAFDGVRDAMDALRAAMAGSETDDQNALEAATAGANRVTEALEQAETAAKGAVAAGKQAGTDTAVGADEALTGLQAVTSALSDYADKASETGRTIGAALVSAFKGAEDALVGFVTRGKLDFAGLANAMLADITRIALQSAILGPLATALGGAFGGATGAAGGGGLLAGVFHDGGVVGVAGPGPARMMPAAALAMAPRMHAGGMAGLRPDEVPAILQRGEMVLSRAQLRAMGREERDNRAGQDRPVQVMFNITTPDADSFRRSQGQIMAEARRAMARAGRNT